jgi:hypothetical protein
MTIMCNGIRFTASSIQEIDTILRFQLSGVEQMARGRFYKTLFRPKSVGTNSWHAINKIIKCQLKVCKKI